MARRLDPVDVIVTFFEKAPLDQATLVLGIVRGVVARRHPPAWPKGKTTKAGRRMAGVDHNADAVIPSHVKTTKGGLTDEELQQ